MPLYAREDTGFERELIPQGMYHAICYGVYDLGTQQNPRFGNSKRQCLICFEIPELRMELEATDNQPPKDQPRAISKFYTLSLYEGANLRRDLESWRGKAFTSKELKGFDITKLIGVNCFINIVHKKKENGQDRESITAITPLPKSVEKRDLENSPQLYIMEEHGLDIPDNAPNWIKNKIAESKEWKEANQQDHPIDESEVFGEVPSDEDDGDDIPF